MIALAVGAEQTVMPVPGAEKSSSDSENRSGRKNRLPQLTVLGSVEDGAETYRKIRETGGVILTVRFGSGNGKRLERALENLAKQDCRVLGVVVVKADEAFLKWYYMGSGSWNCWKRKEP